MNANYPSHAADTCRAYMATAEGYIERARVLLRKSAPAADVALVLKSAVADLDWARDGLMTWAAPPDPPEATERAMKGRDVVEMIGGAKR